MYKNLLLLFAVFSAYGVSAQYTVKQGGCGGAPDCYTTIQAAVNAAAGGSPTITVFPGTYVENVVINKDLTLMSDAGAALTTIEGISPTSYQGAINIYPLPGNAIATVTIGGASGHGFTIKGNDNSSAGVESSAIIIGNNDFSTMRRVEISANKIICQGESAILTYQSNADYINAISITNNFFYGQTFTGAVPYPSNSPFVDVNVARPIVAINPGVTSVTIEQNKFDAITGRERNGNVAVLVTASQNSTIFTNDFKLHTGGFNGGMNVRGGPNGVSDIRCNRLNLTDAEGVPNSGVYFLQTGNNAPPYNINNVAQQNTFLPAGYIFLNIITTTAFGVQANSLYPAPGCRVLPVSEMKLTARALGTNKIDVFWTTTNELNNKYFTVQKSADGKNFTSESITASKGNGSFTYNQQITGISSDIVYLRLMQLDVDGRESFSDIITVRMGANGQLYISRNPVRSSIQINGMSGVTTLNLYNFTGVLVSNKKTNSNTETIDVSSLPSGVYLLRATDENKKTTTFKIVKE